MEVYANEEEMEDDAEEGENEVRAKEEGDEDAAEEPEAEEGATEEAAEEEATEDESADKNCPICMAVNASDAAACTVCSFTFE